MLRLAFRLLVVVVLLVLWVPAARAWTWPVGGPVLQGFSFDRSHPYAGGQHRGVDIGSSPGAPVLAPAAGTVTFAGSVPVNGLTVTIETADGLAVTLTHLGSVSVGRGATASEGAAIATVGPSGTPEIDGPYVHLGIRVASDPNGYLDPLSLLPPASVPSSPGPTPAPAPQQEPTAVPSTPETVSPGNAASAAPAAPAAGAPAAVEVPASDFATHPADVSSSAPSPAPEPKMAVVSASPRAVGAGAVPAAVRPARSAQAARPAAAVGTVPSSQRSGSRPAAESGRGRTALPPSPEVTGRAHSASHPDAPRPAGIPKRAHASTLRAGARAPRTGATSRRVSARLEAFAAVGVALVGLVLGALLCRRRRVRSVPQDEEAIVLRLPVRPRPETPREHDRLAA